MAAPRYRQEAPPPHPDWVGRKEVDAPSARSLVKLARLWRPVETFLEIAACTIARYALRVIDRTTGIPYSADELEAKILQVLATSLSTESIALPGGVVINGSGGSAAVYGTANPALDIRRTTAGTDNVAGTATLTAVSTGDVLNGFGPVLSFRISDTGVANNLIGAIGFLRSGSDMTGDFVIRPQRAGSAAERLRVTADGAIVGAEAAATPAAPSANGFAIYAEDNGAGKTRLMVRFATGAAQQIAIEP